MKKTPSIITAIALGAFTVLTVSCGKKTQTSVEMPAEDAAPEASDSYPLKTCVVSGEPLGEMGEPYVHVHEGTTVKFCCKSCLKDFNADPDKYIAIIKEAEAK
jgi:YHS domain-containing protein